MRDSALIAVPFDKGVWFYVIKKSTYAVKLEKVLDGKQFRKLEKSFVNIVMKNEKELNKKFLDMRKKGKIPVNVEKDEQLLSLDVKSLYTNVPVKEAIYIALRSHYATDYKADIPRTTKKRLLELAVPNVHFKCNESWYCQKDGLARGSSLAVILADL